MRLPPVTSCQVHWARLLVRSKVVTEALEDTIRWSANIDADDMTWLRLIGAHHGGWAPYPTPAPDLKANTSVNTICLNVMGLCSLSTLRI